MKQKTLWIILLVLGIIPFVYVLCYGLFSSSRSFIESIKVYSSIIWPLYILGLFLIVLSIIKLKRK